MSEVAHLPAITVDDECVEVPLVPAKRMYEYEFQNAPLSIVHPAINRGEPANGTLVGSWYGLHTSPSEFRVHVIDAAIVMPWVDLELPGVEGRLRFNPGLVELNFSPSLDPGAFGKEFEQANTGHVDMEAGTYAALFALQAHFREAPVELESVPLLIRVGGALIEKTLHAGGQGSVTGGWLSDASIVLLCSKPPKKPKKKKPCGAPNPNIPGNTCQIVGNHNRTTHRDQGGNVF